MVGPTATVLVMARPTIVGVEWLLQCSIARLVPYFPVIEGRHTNDNVSLFIWEKDDIIFKTFIHNFFVYILNICAHHFFHFIKSPCIFCFIIVCNGP